MKTLAEISEMSPVNFAVWTREFYRFQMMSIYQNWYQDLQEEYKQQHPDYVLSTNQVTWQDYRAACDAILSTGFKSSKGPDQYRETFQNKYCLFPLEDHMSQVEHIQALIEFEKKIIELDITDSNKDRDWPEVNNNDDLELLVRGYWEEILMLNLSQQEDSRWFEFLYCLQRAHIPLERIDSNHILDIFAKLIDPSFQNEILSTYETKRYLVLSDYLSSLRSHAQMLKECPHLVASYSGLIKHLQEQNFDAILNDFETNYELIKEMRDRELKLPDNSSLKWLKRMVKVTEQLMNEELNKQGIAAKLRKELKVENPYFNKILLKLLHLNLKTEKFQPVGASRSSIVENTRGFYLDLMQVSRQYPKPYLHALIAEMDGCGTFDQKFKIYDRKNKEISVILENLSQLIHQQKDKLFPLKKGLAGKDELTVNPIDEFLVLLDGIKAPDIALSVRHRTLSEWVNHPEHRQLFKVDSRMQWLKQLVNALFSALGKKQPVFTLQKIRQDLSIFHTTQGLDLPKRLKKN